jgi:hypothetical protein
MRRSRPSSLAFLAIAVVAVALCGSAFAFFSGKGTGTATAAVSALAAPTITGATPAVGGSVALTWSAATAPGSGAVTYYVLRDGESAEGTCPTEASPQAILRCTDLVLAPGTHEYTVVAEYHSWTVESEVVKAKVKTGATAQLSIAASTTTPAAGASVKLTITAQDEEENTVTTYTGSHSLVFSGAAESPGGTAPSVVDSSGTAIPFGSATALTFTKGVATVSSSSNGLMKIYDSGVAEINATDGSVEDPTPLVVSVSSGTASKFTVGAATTTPTAGVPDDLTITAVDTYGNAAETYKGTKSVIFSGPAASPDGTAATVANKSGAKIAIGSSTSLEFVAGVATAKAGANGTATLYKSGTNTIKATEGSITTSTALSLSVSPAEPPIFTMTASNTAPVANASTNLTLAVKDEYENAITSYAGTKEITFSGAEASPSGAEPNVIDESGVQVPFGTPTELSFTNGTASVHSGTNGLLRLPRSGTTNVVATDGELTTAPLTFTVSVGTAKRVAFSGLTRSAGLLAEGCYFTCTITGLGARGTVGAKGMITDESGNVLTAQSSRTVAVKVTGTSGSTLTGTSLAFPKTGAAISTTAFAYTAPNLTSYANTITASTSGLTSGTFATSR